MSSQASTKAYSLFAVLVHFIIAYYFTLGGTKKCVVFLTQHTRGITMLLCIARKSIRSVRWDVNENKWHHNTCNVTAKHHIREG